MKSQTVRTESAEETFRFGVTLGESMTGGETILLSGPLGAGKTTLTQGICRGLGLPDSTPVRSPSFALINEYHGGRRPIRHADLYRLDDPAEIDDLGLFDEADDVVVIVEWADRYGRFPYERSIAITVTLDDGDRRSLRLEDRRS